jgi:hypothetical protein
MLVQIGQSETDHAGTLPLSQLTGNGWSSGKNCSGNGWSGTGSDDSWHFLRLGSNACRTCIPLSHAHSNLVRPSKHTKIGNSRTKITLSFHFEFDLCFLLISV